MRRGVRRAVDILAHRPDERKAERAYHAENNVTIKYRAATIQLAKIHDLRVRLQLRMDTTDSMQNDGFILSLPMFSYLIEPGPQPGFLRDSKTQMVFVPLWTDDDLFDRYLNRLGLAQKVSGLQIHSIEEFVTYLRSIPDQIQHVVVDPNPSPPQNLVTWKIKDLLDELGA